MTAAGVPTTAFLSRQAFAAAVRAHRPSPPNDRLGEPDALERYLALCAAIAVGAEPDPGTWAWDTLDELYDRYVLSTLDEPSCPGGADHALAGRFAALRPLLPEDLSWALLFLSRGERFTQPPLRGQTPTPGELAELLWRDALCVLVTQDRGTGTPWGIVRAHTPNPSGTQVLLDLWLDDATLAAGWGVEAWLLVVRHLFAEWPLDAVRMEIPAFAHPPLASADGWLLRDEGTLTAHLWRSGRYWDVYLRSLPRPVWEEHQPILLPRRPDDGRGSNPPMGCHDSTGSASPQRFDGAIGEDLDP